MLQLCVNKCKILLIIVILFSTYSVYAEESVEAVRYSSLYFGPNACPVPHFADARIPVHTTIEAAANYYNGYGGDHTYNASLSAEVPFIAERLSLKVWTPFLEYYTIPRSVARFQHIDSETTTKSLKGITYIGDVYVQTRISILAERKFIPALILNITLKTASSNAEDFLMKRYFDTPGYYFDLELGKSLTINSLWLKEIRIAADIGFLCWETTASVQNDAIMGGLKFVVAGKRLRIENSFGGYSGWMGNGDNPIVFASKWILGGGGGWCISLSIKEV